MIFEHLDLSSLLALSQVNGAFHILTADVYRRKFSHRTIVISKYLYEMNTDITEYSDYTPHIEKFEVAAKLFKYFGSEVTKVELYNVVGYMENSLTGLVKHIFSNRKIPNGIKEVVKLININSSGLKDLKLICNDVNPLKYVNLPFVNVEHLTLNGKFKRLRSQHLKFNEMFPKLRRLYLDSVRLLDPKSLTVSFQHLEHLRVDLSIHGSTEADMEIFIEKNPQIRSISIYCGSMIFIRFLSKHLPNLEYLHISSIKGYRSAYEDVIHFKNVKNLKINSNRLEIPRYITFDQLEELELIGSSRIRLPVVWIEFIGRNVNLQKLKLIWKMSNDQLRSFKDNVPNLIDAFLELEEDVQAETIATFLDGQHKMQIFSFIYLPESTLATLRTQIENEWKLSRLETLHNLIERRS